MIRSAFLFASLLAAAASASAGGASGEAMPAGDVVQMSAGGVVNWSGGFIQCSGQGAPDVEMFKTNKAQARILAERAALADAYRRVLEVARGVALTSETTVEKAITTSDTIRMAVDGVVKGAQVVANKKTGDDYTYFDDGGVKVTVRVALDGDGGLAGVLIPTLDLMKDSAKPTAAPGTGSDGSSAGASLYTGLVVDARATQVKPALAPRILSESGTEVYGTGYVTREYAVQHGLAGYHKDLDGAKKSDRVTDNPLVVQAVRAQGCDLVISSADAAKIEQLRAALSFLEKCRVIFVLK